MKHPCMAMCWATNGTVIRTRYEKWEEPPRVGGGRGEGVRRGKEPSVTITCNLAVPATHDNALKVCSVRGMQSKSNLNEATSAICNSKSLLNYVSYVVLFKPVISCKVSFSLVRPPMPAASPTVYRRYPYELLP